MTAYPAVRTAILLVIIFMSSVACTRPSQVPVVTIDASELLGVRHDLVPSFSGLRPELPALSVRRLIDCLPRQSRSP